MTSPPKNTPELDEKEVNMHAVLENLPQCPHDPLSDDSDLSSDDSDSTAEADSLLADHYKVLQVPKTFKIPPPKPPRTSQLQSLKTEETQPDCKPAEVQVVHTPVPLQQVAEPQVIYVRQTATLLSPQPPAPPPLPLNLQQSVIRSPTIEVQVAPLLPQQAPQQRRDSKWKKRTHRYTFSFQYKRFLMNTFLTLLASVSLGLLIGGLSYEYRKSLNKENKAADKAPEVQERPTSQPDPACTRCPSCQWYLKDHICYKFYDQYRSFLYAGALCNRLNASLVDPVTESQWLLLLHYADPNHVWINAYVTQSGGQFRTYENTVPKAQNRLHRLSTNLNLPPAPTTPAIQITSKPDLPFEERSNGAPKPLRRQVSHRRQRSLTRSDDEDFEDRSSGSQFASSGDDVYAFTSAPFEADLTTGVQEYGDEPIPFFEDISGDGDDYLIDPPAHVTEIPPRMVETDATASPWNPVSISDIPDDEAYTTQAPTTVQYIDIDTTTNGTVSTPTAAPSYPEYYAVGVVIHRLGHGTLAHVSTISADLYCKVLCEVPAKA